MAKFEDFWIDGANLKKCRIQAKLSLPMEDLT